MKTKPNKVFLKVPKGKKSVLRILKDGAKQFCVNTGFHGYRFIVLPKRTLLERIIWLIICLVALTTALILLSIAWFDFQKTPTVVVTDSTHYPIWNYPFPAVTICDYNKISKAKALQLGQILFDKNGSDSAWALRVLFHLIHNSDPYISVENLQEISHVLAKMNQSVNTYLQELAPSCDDVLRKCKWKGEEKICNSIFEQIKSSERFCCAFNYLALKNHAFHGKSIRKVLSPRKVSGCGYQTGLEILVNNNPLDYFASYIPSIGYRVIIHDSYYFPDLTQQSILSEMGTVNLINVDPTMTSSSEYIRGMDISTRNCLFSDERNLLNFKRYNFHNCMVECRMNLTIKLCGCIPYFYVNLEDDSINVCTIKDIACLAENQSLIDSSVPGFNFSSIGQNHVYGSEKDKCGCLPDCENVEYSSDYSTSFLEYKSCTAYAEFVPVRVKLEWAVPDRCFSERPEATVECEFAIDTYYCIVHSHAKITQQANFCGGIDISNHSVIRVFFKDLVAIKNRRDVIFNWQTLLAYFGGILGLFVGFSFISGMEIIYFFFIRLFHDILKNKKSRIEHETYQKHYNTRIWVHENFYSRAGLLFPEYINVRRRNNMFYHIYSD